MRANAETAFFALQNLIPVNFSGEAPAVVEQLIDAAHVIHFNWIRKRWIKLLQVWVKPIQGRRGKMALHQFCLLLAW